MTKEEKEVLKNLEMENHNLKKQIKDLHEEDDRHIKFLSTIKSLLDI